MRPDETHKQQTVQEELEALSPLVARLRQREVPLPLPHYFDALANEAIAQASGSGTPKRITKFIPIGVAAMAAAACIIVGLVVWAPTTNSPAPVAASMHSLTDEELIQLALQEEALLEGKLMEDDSLVLLLAANTGFQFLAPATDANQEYNKLLLEMIDDETLLEDIL